MEVQLSTDEIQAKQQLLQQYEPAQEAFAILERKTGRALCTPSSFYQCVSPTDLDVEDELLQLKQQGIELDKSEIVEELLSAG